MKAPKRDRDVRVEITHRVFGELASRYWINKGTILDGTLDKAGNFITTGRRSATRLLDPPSFEEELTIYPTHFKILGKFYFRKSR